MDYLTLQLLLLLLISFLSFIHIFMSSKSSKQAKLLPPGPRPFPIIGNILDLGSVPHQALTSLSKRYGPILSLKLGTITTIVISSVDMAKEALHKNDLAFSSRTVPDTACSLGHDKVSMVWMAASSKWRILRRACATNLFSPHQLDCTRALRQKKVQELVDHVGESCRKGEALDIGEAAFTTALNSISNTFFSMDFAHYTSDKAHEFKDTIWGIMVEAGRPNVADYFPVLRKLDPQGARARMDQYFGKLLAFFDGIIEEKLHSRDSKMEPEISNDVLDSFLNLMTDSQLTRHEVLHLFLVSTSDLFAAGIDTTSSTVEWAMAELMHNPDKLIKTKQELEQLLGKDGKFEESRISEFRYLQAVVKETLRLHPPVPFLVPHKSENDVQIGSFLVPKNAQILVNLWAMGRDSGVWKNPNSFEPERFLEGEIDLKGRNFEFIPFGAGRRICPGLPLANRSVHLMLAALLHNFDWVLTDGQKPKDMDMSDKFGLTLKKAQPLRAIPTKRIM